MGIANIIPGVSGGTLALTLGIYEEFISAISHFFSNFKKNIKFLIPVFAGIGLSLVLLSGVMKKALSDYPIITALFFMGLVIGGIPLIYKKIKDSKEKSTSNYIIMGLTFLLVMFLTFSDMIFSNIGTVSLSNMNLFGYILLFFVGVIAAATMVIPGVSGSLVLILLGYYEPIVSTISDFIHMNDLVSNMIILIVFGLGVLVGIVGVSKLIEYLFKKYEVKTYYGVLGFVTSSIVAIPVSIISSASIVFNLPQVLLGIVIGIIFMILGIIIGNKIGEK